MSYPGNPSLSADVQQRILSTFEQTLDLAAEGSHQEALLGCDFVLRMDPQFQAARTLQERLRGAAGAVAVNDLRAGAPATINAHDPFGTLDGVSLDLPDLPDADFFGNSAAAPIAAPGSDLRAELAALLGERRFPELLQRAQQNMGAIATDPELQRIAGFAQERLEAEPYVVKFLGSAREAQRKGDLPEVERLLAKARSLDPSHPGIAEVERSLGARAAAPTASPVSLPSPVVAPASPFDNGSFGGDSESARRIQELLHEGQTAFDAGDPQAAIDAWSRIFLIDIDHQEASRRIELARKLKAEMERLVEEIFHDGLSGLENGDLAGARQAFQRVLELQPGHITAREYLDQLAAGTVPVVRAASREMPALSPEPALPVPSDFEGGQPQDLKEEILVPPDPSEVAGRPAPRREPKPITAPKERKPPSRLFLMVGAVVLLLVMAGGWWFFQNRERLFPNSDEETEGLGAVSASPINRAVGLQQGGKTSRAIALLRRIPPSDPHYKEAQALIAKWESAGAPSASSAVGPPPEVLARRQGFLDQARSAYGERSYLTAADRYSKAASLAPLDPPDAESFADAKRQIEPLRKYVELYQQHDWEFILRDLWDMHDKDPNNRDVNRLLADSCYNLGVLALQRADMKRAAESFQDVLDVVPDDPVARRHLLFAQTYQEREKDLLYRIYVKYLPTR
jgi:tetratricopeptide (TPR) repeat protein